MPRDCPGVPLPSGFRTLTDEERQRVELSPEAKARVLAKMRSVDEARLHAMAEAHGYVIG